MDGGSPNSPVSLLLAGDVVETSSPNVRGCCPYWSCDKSVVDEIEESDSTPRPSCSNTITTSNGKTVGVVSGIVRKLDVTTASTIRKTQVINQVSDIVRELVENSVDANSTNIQVLLSNFGLDEIIVQDTGSGISRSDLFHVMSGGYTSKLEDRGNLSAQSHYGFRGEALSSICSVATVCITTKTPTDTHATKYTFDNSCRIVSETTVAGGNGTHIVATDLFEKYPVRRGHIKEKNNCVEQLKKVESFVKSVAIANPKTHIRLFHNKSLIWSKASVGSIDQALMAVLGHAISKSLSRCGPVELEVAAEEDDKKKERTIEAFFLNKPIDMKTMSYTSRRMTFIFINRKRVHVHEFEKIIRRYTAATIANPTPAERRRFPVAVINIKIPDDEVDFNREMDKTKVFLVQKDNISAKLEELLQKFYGITSLENDSGSSGSTVSSTSTEQNPTSPNMFDVNEEISSFPFTTGEVSTSLLKERQSTIQSFMENFPTVSETNFCQASIKTEGSVPFSSLRPSPPTKKSNQCISNFDCNLDDILMDTPPEEMLPAVEVNESLKIVRSDQCTINLVELDKSKTVNMKNSSISPFESSLKQDAITISETGRVIDMNLWVHGRIPDNHGSILKSVNIVSSPCQPSNPLESVPQSSSASQHLNGCKNPKSTNAFDYISSGLAKCSDAKRPKLNNNCNRSQLSQKSTNQSGISLSGTPRQITLNQFKNWDTPASKRKSSSENIFRAPSPGLRLISPPTSSSISISATSFPAFQSGTQQEQDNFSGTQNSGRILGTLTDSSLYTVKINDFVGIFHPMNMLQEFPSLKYDLKIGLQKLSQPGTELDAQYVVEKQCVPKLFHAFILRLDPMCNNYPKIFHKLQSLNDIAF